MKHKKLSPTELKKKIQPSGEKKTDFHLKCTKKILSLLQSQLPITFLMVHPLKWLKISRALCSTKSAKC